VIGIYEPVMNKLLNKSSFSGATTLNSVFLSCVGIATLQYVRILSSPKDLKQASFFSN
jgi:hypothetical protein